MNSKRKWSPEDQTWMNNLYGSLKKALLVERYFANFFKALGRSDKETLLYLEAIEIEFLPPNDLPEMRVQMQYASKTLRLQIPDEHYSEAVKAQLREMYLKRFAPVLRESQVRTNMLLWSTFSDTEKKKILRDASR